MFDPQELPVGMAIDNARRALKTVTSQGHQRLLNIDGKELVLLADTQKLLDTLMERLIRRMTS